MRTIVTLDKKPKLYAILLFAISIVLISYGLYLDLNGNNRLFDPIKDVTNADVNNSKSKTNIDVDSLDDDAKDNSVSENPITSEDSSIQNNETEETNRLEPVNNRLRNQMEKKYGVEIKYAEETTNHTVGDLGTTPLEDIDTININLRKLDKVLSHYPDGMFTEINNGGIPLTIYLVNKFSQTGITGVTDSNAYFANITIATAYPFEESFYHESFHYIERYMNERKKLYFNTWNTYNPQGFIYGESVNSELSYASNGGSESSYFVNNYAQSAEAEDRASTFEYMMANTKAACLKEDQPVWKKAKKMAQTIEAALDTCSPNEVEYWERFL